MALSYDPEVHWGQSLIFFVGCRKDRIPNTARLRRETRLYSFTQPRKVHPLFSFRHKSRLSTVVYTHLCEIAEIENLFLLTSCNFGIIFTAVEKGWNMKVQRRCEMVIHCQEMMTTSWIQDLGKKTEDKYRISGRLHDKRPFWINLGQPNNRIHFCVLHFSLNLHILYNYFLFSIFYFFRSTIKLGLVLILVIYL